MQKEQNSLGITSAVTGSIWTSARVPSAQCLCAALQEHTLRILLLTSTKLHQVKNLLVWKKSLILCDYQQHRSEPRSDFSMEQENRSLLVSRAVGAPWRYPVALSIYTGMFPFPSFAIVYYNKLRALTSPTEAHCRQVKKHNLSDAIVNIMQPPKSQFRQNICK